MSAFQRACTRQGERDIAQVLIGSGLSSSETFREQAKVHRTLQPNCEKGWQEQGPYQTQGQLWLGGWGIACTQSVLHHKEYLFTGACLQCLFSSRIHLCPNKLHLLPCLHLYSSSQRKTWPVFHNPVAENSMPSGYAQPNGAMHSRPTSHKEKKGLSQIVTSETRMMQSNSYTKKAICWAQAGMKHP